MVTAKAQDPNDITVFPAKSFFANIITRDIDLGDAIMDLLDNCVDGVRRQSLKEGAKPYAGFYARISYDQNEFIIEDNCGGIPIKAARDHAFMFGRPTGAEGEKGTIGIYGIGMKRAIFKMGRSCVVHSHHSKDTFEVHISPEWLEDDDNWKLKIEPTKPKLEEYGTRIVVRNLDRTIKLQFTRGSAFEREFNKRVQWAFTLLIQKGFCVSINGKEITAVSMPLQWDERGTDGKFLRPYVYEAQIEQVKVFIAIGVRDVDRPGPSRGEDDEDSGDEEVGGRYESSKAGWTVSCNDRIVLFCDKTEKTGWRTAGMPEYHLQYSGITGFVEFHSNDAKKLPFNTTKNGINVDAAVYFKVLDRMRDGLKRFVAWTNAWKEESAERREIIARAKPKTLEEIKLIARKEKFGSTKEHSRELLLKVELPKPRAERTNSIVRFERRTKDVEQVSRHLFDEIRPAAAVGAECFDRVLAQAKKYG